MLMNKISNVLALIISYKKVYAWLLLDLNEPKLCAVGGKDVTLNS